MLLKEVDRGCDIRTHHRMLPKGDNVGGWRMCCERIKGVLLGDRDGVIRGG